MTKIKVLTPNLDDVVKLIHLYTIAKLYNCVPDYSWLQNDKIQKS